MIIFNDDLCNKIQRQNHCNPTIKHNVKRTRRKQVAAITKSNKEFLRALGLKI